MKKRGLKSALLFLYMLRSKLVMEMENKIISEKELLKMPESDYMNAKQRHFFKSLLTTMQANLKSEIVISRSNMHISNDVGDTLDLAADAEMMQINLRTTERKTKLLHKVEESLIKIDNGTYGFCVETGYRIGIKRLLARPTATLSIDSKEQQEFHERTEGVSDIGDNKDADDAK
jgi:DnaK suppressor protein